MKRTTEELALIWTAAYSVAFATMLHAQTITQEELLEENDLEDIDMLAKYAADRVSKTLEEMSDEYGKQEAAETKAAVLRRGRVRKPSREED